MQIRKEHPWKTSSLRVNTAPPHSFFGMSYFYWQLRTQFFLQGDTLHLAFTASIDH